MSYSTRERIAHTYRRLGIGSQPDLLESTDTVDEAIARSLQLEDDPPELVDFAPPDDPETATDIATLAEPLRSWIGSMASSPRVIEERLVWFWHDHFSTAIQKVRIPYLLWQQHLTIRARATGHFGDLLYEVATDPAMLLYLDGARNAADEVNENFAREVMELHTMGPGNYSQADVTEAARAATGWVVNVPYARLAQQFLSEREPWSSVFIPFRHDSGEKTILGTGGRHGMSDLVDVLLEQPATARFVARKMFIELVGLEPDENELDALATGFRSNYSIMGLVESIASSPTFAADSSIRAKIRTPVERLVAVSQGLGDRSVDEQSALALHGMSFLPFNPPSPAGFPRGPVLLGPHQLVHSFDLLAAAEPTEDMSTDQLAARLGIPDLAPDTRAVLESAPNSSYRLALAVNSPEFALV